MMAPTIEQALTKLDYTIKPCHIYGRKAIFNIRGYFVGDFTAFDAINYLEATYGPQVLQAESPEPDDNNPVKRKGTHEPPMDTER